VRNARLYMQMSVHVMSVHVNFRFMNNTKIFARHTRVAYATEWTKRIYWHFVIYYVQPILLPSIKLQKKIRDW